MRLYSAKDLAEALRLQRFETARRIGLHLLATPAHLSREMILDLHRALVALGDFRAALQLLREPAYAAFLDNFLLSFLLAEDFHLLMEHSHYRASEEEQSGWTYEQYTDKYRKLALEKYAAAEQLACSAEQRGILAKSLIRSGPESSPNEQMPSPKAIAFVQAAVFGIVVGEDRGPIPGARLILGASVASDLDDPVVPEATGLNYEFRVGPMETFESHTAADGSFRFEKIPAGKYDYLAISLDESCHDISTHFIAREIILGPDSEVDLGFLAVQESTSAPTEVVSSPHVDSFLGWIKAAEIPLNNPFAYDFPRQLLRLPMPANSTLGGLKVFIIPDREEVFQISGTDIVLFVALPAHSSVWIAIYKGNDVGAPKVSSSLQFEKEPEGTWRVETGACAFRIAGEYAGESLPPIVQVRGPDGIWRGQGRLRLADGVFVTRRTSSLLERGPVQLVIECACEFSNGGTWSLTMTALAGEPYLLVHEKSVGCKSGSFEFSLEEFSQGRGFLHWLPETGSTHWTTLGRENREVARLPESVPWWIPPQGFACALTPDVLDAKDYIALFSLRRGEWIDHEFERLAQGPIDENGHENRELDWPFPEMVGSSISCLQALTSIEGDAFFRFGFFEGERHWGLLVSSLEQNDGPDKQVAAVQHGNSSPRLQDFKDWHLDEADAVVRPCLLAKRNELIGLRGKRRIPGFDRIWEKIRRGNVEGASAGLVFAIEGDPRVAWRRRLEILCDLRVRTRMTLLGRDRGDMYSPVGGRSITRLAEDYDLLAASRVFSEREERTIRASLILLGHMFMECDLMNWRYNSRNANFEADRVEIVGTIGLVFEGHPDSEKFLKHGVERTSRAFEIYCTPGSGKWYENPACYYLQALKCRTNLIYHLAKSGRLDFRSLPRLKDFLRWGIVTLTPPKPTSYAVLRDGGGTTYDAAEKVRTIPPIGDHAGLGRWLPEHFALFGILYRDLDRNFGNELLDAYFCSNADGARLLAGLKSDPHGSEEQPPGDGREGATHGNLPLFFVEMKTTDLPVHPKVNFKSQLLEGFGAVIRDQINTPDEVYILIKQGPGGYRYHRTEGSLLLFTHGRPLIYDGGEGGETWRHSTLSAFDSHMPLAVGHVERAFFDPAFQLVQGVHPQFISPGEPIFLSDSCDHRLVPECYRRFRVEPPAVIRSYAWIGASYLIVHDDLTISPSIPVHWNLQVVADSEIGNAADGFRFHGRFGIDLVAQFPGQSFSSESVRHHSLMEYQIAPENCFAMRHLQLSSPVLSSCLAILAPTASGAQTDLQSESLQSGNRIIGSKIKGATWDDIVWFARGGIDFSDKDVSFEGQYGASLKRGDCHSIIAVGPAAIRHGSFHLESEGPSVVVAKTPTGLEVRAEGRGPISFRSGIRRRELTCDGSCIWRFPD